MSGWVHLIVARPEFRRLWLSGVVSLTGDWLGFVAVSLLTLGSGGGALGLAILLAAHMLPHALLAPVAAAAAGGSHAGLVTLTLSCRRRGA